MLTIGKDPETWLVHRVLERRAAERPDHPVMHWDGRDCGYGAINREANRIAAGFEAHGIEPGARVAVMMQNTPAHVFVWFATAKLGVVAVPVNTAYRGDILAHVVTSARATAMVLDADFVPVVARIAARCPGLGTFIVAGIVAGSDLEEARRALPGAVLSLDELATGDGADRPRGDAATDTACIMFTSGTTGPSKGVVINHHFELSFAVIFNEIVSLGARDVTYNFLPFFHIAGKFIMLGKMLAAFRSLWFHSGDRGHKDEAGYLHFHDRMKDAIRRRGENISSFEVERIVNKHADVAETAAIAVAAEVGEDEVKVVVVRNPGAALTEEALLRHCVAEMPYFMVPRFIEFRADLPRTPTQKVRKVALRADGIAPATWVREAAGFEVTRDGLARRG